MANIFLTGECNLKCPYCFASEFVHKNDNEITIENFLIALDFIKTSANERVGLIGGEPLLHSRFDEILKILIKDSEVKHVNIFTNGLNIDKHINLLTNPKITLLINCNSPDIIGENNYSKLAQNIELLQKEKKEGFFLGLNLFEGLKNYNFIFDLLNIAKSHYLRFSVAIYKQKMIDDDILKNYAKNKNLLIDFWSLCLKNEIVPANDCNSIPVCLMDTQMKKLLLQLDKLGEKWDTGSSVMTHKICNPVIDIMPDLTAVRCFGLADNKRVSINDFKNLDNLKKYFFHKIDIPARIACVSDDCEECKFAYLEKCGVCFSYKLNKQKGL